MNINEIGAKTGHCCECEAPMSMDSRTIKDNYAGFCAAVTKRVFGSTSQAKKVLARTRKETSK